MIKSKQITPEVIEHVLQGKLSQSLREQCQRADLRYAEISPTERDHYILEVVETLTSDSLTAAGKERLHQWESGWGQNLMAFSETRDPAALIPRYHGKHRLLHWKQKIIRPLVPNFDYNIHCLLVDWAMETYLGDRSAIFEFGCGPAYQLLRARRVNPTALLVGLDWANASQEIIEKIKAYGVDSNITGRRFDYYDPDDSLTFQPNSGVLTVASLEQIGERFEPFLNFLLRKRPAICVHFETIDELMDPNNLIDRLSVLYARKRNYLKGYLTALRKLQNEGKVKILREQRTYTGSYYIEGHSLVVWKPI